MKNAATELDWVRERLGDPYSGVTAIVPAGLDANVRVFHPAESDHGGEPSRSWAEIAEQRARLPSRRYLMLRGELGSSEAREPGGGRGLRRHRPCWPNRPSRPGRSSPPRRS